MVSDKSGNFSTTYHITESSKTIPEIKSDPNLYYGRPDLTREILALEPYGMDGAVVVCGPTSLIEECSRISSAVHFIAEHFEF